MPFPPELLVVLALGAAFAALSSGRTRLRAGGRPAAPGRRSERLGEALDVNPYRAVRILPAQSFRAPRAAARGRDAASPSALATDWVRRLLGSRYTLVAEVPLADLVRFDHPRYGGPADHRELRVRTASWVIGERSSGRVRLVVAPPGGLRDAMVAALEADGVAVWSFERWRGEVLRRDAVDLRNALVRHGLTIDPFAPPA